MQISEALVVLMADSSPSKWHFCESVFCSLHLRILCRAANWNRNPLENSILILQFTLVSMQYYIVLEYTVTVWSENVLQLGFSQDLLFFDSGNVLREITCWGDKWQHQFSNLNWNVGSISILSFIDFSFRCSKNGFVAYKKCVMNEKPPNYILQLVNLSLKKVQKCS